MSTEAEFKRWLQRPEKSFLENLQFALKAWKSAEFTLSSKYELVLQWLAKRGEQLGRDEQTLQQTELTEVLQLKCQPGLIAKEVKLEFVQMLLHWASNWQTSTSRLPSELLQQLLDFEIVQDLLRSNYELYAKLFGQLLRSYEQYLWSIQNGCFLPTHESKFFLQIMNGLRTSAKKTGDLDLYRQHYTTEVLQPLVQVLLVLQQHELRFFDELLSLEKQLCEHLDEATVLKRIMLLPMHVRLLTLECAIVNQRGVEKFQSALLQFIFKELLEQQDPALMLTIIAYTLEMFRKHDINLNFPINKTTSALTFLGEMIYRYVEMYKDEHLQLVLQLLCATLRLNPLILENIFHLTTWMIVAEKRTCREQELFEEYLKLLMDMFRKLSRTEKFVVNLLRTLKEWLNRYKLPSSVMTGKGKRKLQEGAPKLLTPTPQKQRKLSGSANEPMPDDTSRYLDIIFKEFHAATISAKPTPATCLAQLQSFPQLSAAWPWDSVGMDFSKLIVSLMSKPSLVIWKSLIFSIKEKLQVADPQQEELSENFVFELDFIAALLCQYFAGSKLAEQSDKFWNDIAEMRKLTVDVLAEFGRFLLRRSHNKRTMNAFLECCYYVAHFQLLVWYYRSDRLADSADCQEQAKHIHDFLTDDEWTLLQQRVINFGKTSCKFNFNRLLLQRSQARLLFASHKKPLNLQKIMLAPLGNDLEQLQLLLQVPSSKWLLRSLKHEEKLDIVRLIINENSFDDAQLQSYSDDLEFFELLCLGLYEQLASSFAAVTKKSLLGSIEFEELRIEADAAQDKRVSLVAEAIKAKIAPYALKKLPMEEVKPLLKALKQLPLGYCRRQLKGVLFALHLALFRDLKAAQQEEQAGLVFEILTDMLHFGQQIQIFKYFSAEDMLQLLPVDAAWEFYEFLYASMKNDEKGAERFLSVLVEILKAAQQEEKLDDAHIKLMLITIETLSALNGPSAKRLRKHLEEVLVIYAKHVNTFFAQVEGRSAKKDKRFVEKTLPGFAAYVKSKLGKQGSEAQNDTLDEHFRRVCKIYIGYSMDYNNMHAIKLISVALNYRQALHFDQDEIEFVLNGYWRQLKADHKLQKLDEKNAEAVIKLVIGNKTNEDLLLTLKEICDSVQPENFTNITHLLTLIAKCSFSTIKGAIFNEQFKQITFKIVLRLQKDENYQFIDTEQLLNVLACQQAIVENKMVPISSDTLDDMLAFLMDINIKKFALSDTNVKIFNSLHLAMSELCTALLKHRHLLLMDRVPQFTHIFKDLVQSIVCYKSERQKDTALNNEELDDLAELALKLEAMMHIIATHSLEVKRVAPFVLTFVINLMVCNKRPTTLYPKIKTHIENICYDLVGICDHRVGRFILRCSNEAARQVYELLVKDHKKYHKFKGKV